MVTGSFSTGVGIYSTGADESNQNYQSHQLTSLATNMEILSCSSALESIKYEIITYVIVRMGKCGYAILKEIVRYVTLSEIDISRS